MRAIRAICLYSLALLQIWSFKALAAETTAESSKIAVNIAHRWQGFISSLNANSSLEKDLLAEFEILRNDSLKLLDTIHKEALNSQLNEIENYYYLFLLQQISKFNQYFNEIYLEVEKAKNDSYLEAQAFCQYQSPALIKNIQAIKHPLLPAVNVTMRVKVIRNAHQIFRPAYVYENEADEKSRFYYKEKIRFYYNKKTTNDGEEHQDRTHYKKANINIGTMTQYSNFNGLMKSATLGQRRHQYFKHADHRLHAEEQTLFRGATKKIKSGEALSEEELRVLKSGNYYRYNSPIKFMTQQHISALPDYTITHIGHAAEFISINNAIPLQLCVDPVHYQSGTGTGLYGSFVNFGGKIFYARQTDPAFGTEAYPQVNIVALSHNHFDHMCELSLKEAFSNTNTIFIVPIGDAKHMAKFGFKNVVEMGSWNDVVDIHLSDDTGNNSHYQILSFPAKHSSCRSHDDFYESLYMGYLLRDLSKDNLVLITGDTAILDKEHFDQFESYLLKENLSISSACIAHGPDRPRSSMECTHQSTADAIAMHARFNVMNIKVYANRVGKDVKQLSFEELLASECYAIGYHQGCYRLGLLSFNDVDTTLLRILSVLKSLGSMPITKIEHHFKNNIFYNLMDDFEQKGLQETISIYGNLLIDSGVLTASQVFDMIVTHLNVPQPGHRADFSQRKPYNNFDFDYLRIINNRNPQLENFLDAGVIFNPLPAFEYFAAALKPALYMNGLDKIDAKKALAKMTIQLSLQWDETSPIYASMNSHAIRFTDLFFAEIDGANSDDEFFNILNKLYTNIFPKQDEYIRDEGHLYTAVTLLAGLIHFPEFRHTVQARHMKLLGLGS